MRDATPSVLLDGYNERRMGRAIAATAALALAVVLGLAGLVVGRGYQNAVVAAQTDATRVVQATEAELNRSLVALDALLAEVAQWMALPDGGHLSDEVHPVGVRRLLRAALNQNLMLRDVMVVDNNRQVLASARSDAQRLGTEVNAAFLQQIFEQSYPRLYVGLPSVHPLSSEQVLHLGRSVKRPNGQVVVVLAVLRVALLSAQMNPRDREGAIALTLETGNGHLLAAHPQRELPTGQQLSPVLSELASSGQALDLPERLDGQSESWLAVRPLLYPDLWVSASVPREVALALWRIDTQVTAGVVTVLCLLIGGLWLGGVRHVQRMGRARAEVALAHEQLLQSNLALEQSFSMLKATLEATADAIVAVNHDGVVTQFNAHYTQVLGISPERLLGSRVKELRRFLNPLLDNPENVTAVALRAYDEPESETLDELRFSDGRVFLRHSLPQWVDGRVVGRVWSYQDITAFRQIEKRLREREQALKLTRDELAATLEALPDLLFELNEDGLYLDVHTHRPENLVVPPKAFLGKRVRDVLPPATAVQVMACLQQAKTQGSAYGVQIELPVHEQTRWFELSAARKPTPPDEPARFVVIARDITDRKQNETLIWEQAHLDTLTGLPNRRMFREQLSQYLRPYEQAEAQVCGEDAVPVDVACGVASAGAGPRLALFFVDLDRFKEVNDTHGHDIGDLLLQQAAQRIRSCVRDTDLVARLGGDEFTLVVSGLDHPDRITPIARKLLDRLSEPFDLNGDREYISASVGVTLAPDDGTDSDTLIRHADQAMYAAKQGGRNRWERFTLALEETATARARTARDLRTALETEQFQLVYQPIIDLKTGEVHKAEALLRWEHPQHGAISPALFIPVAEDTGLIQDLGQWVFEQASRQVQHWRKHLHPGFQISVNQSAAQFRHVRAGFGSRLWTDRLGQLGLPGNSMVLEITETVLMDASESTHQHLTQLREAGVQLALDDFGTGYSALSYLHKYDLDWLKIDQAFVRHLDASQKDLALCKATIAMAHALGLRVIAEGIETAEQQRLLIEAGCDAGQGFLFSRPLPPAAFELWLAQHQPLPSLLDEATNVPPSAHP